MKKFLTLIVAFLFVINTAFCATDKYSKEYLEQKQGFSITKKLSENIAKRAIRKALKQETGVNFDVKLEGYTASSMKKGIFKYMELTADDVKIDDVNLSYINLKTLSDYNYIDYTKNPLEFKNDMTCAFDILLSDDELNEALKKSEYLKVIDKVNKIAYPLFKITGVRTKIKDNKFYIITDYNTIIKKSEKDRSFVASTNFTVSNGKIRAKNVSIDKAYGNLGLDKVANLINYLNPLEFTLGLLKDSEHKGNIENINIVDNKIKVDGKIFIKGTGK